MRKIGRTILIGSGALAAAMVGASFAVSWHLVRPRRDVLLDSLPNFRFGSLESVQLRTEDGLGLHAWVLITRKAPVRGWVLILHGFRSNRVASMHRARFFSRRGFHVLMLHFRGHGSSQESLISYGYHERKDVKAAFAFIRSLSPEAGIGIIGRSMGAAAAAYAVEQEEVQPDWLILESCYDNIHHALTNRLRLQIGGRLTPLVAWPLERIVERLVELRTKDLDPGKALEKVRCPVLLMAGDSEQVLKVVEIEYLYGCIHSPKRLVLFAGAGHQDFLVYDPRRYIRWVDGFLRDYSPADSVTDH